VVEPVATAVVQAALIDIDATYFFQLALFLVLYLLLTTLFFRPYIEHLRRRDQATVGLRKNAREHLQRAQEIEGEAEGRLDAARQAALLERKKLAEEGTRIRDGIVTRERDTAQARIEQEALELQQARGAFRQRLDALTGELATLIQTQVDSAEGKPE
jgi:F-type H+-transporting ATPase subunit b